MNVRTTAIGISQSYSLLDNTGCIGCEKQGVWGAIDIEQTQSAFCEDDESGYVYKVCIRGESGNGEWNSVTTSDCIDVEPNPTLQNGEAYYRGSIYVRNMRRLDIDRNGSFTL